MYGDSRIVRSNGNNVYRESLKCRPISKVIRLTTRKKEKKFESTGDLDVLFVDFTKDNLLSKKKKKGMTEVRVYVGPVLNRCEPNFTVGTKQYH